MTIYYSDLINQRTLVRPPSMNDAVESVTASVRIPASKNLAIADTLRFMRCDWGVVPIRLTLQSDALDTNNLLAGTLGCIQIVPGTLYASTNGSGVFQTYDVATGTTNVSPATSAANIAASALIQTTLRAGGIITLDDADGTNTFASSFAGGFTGPVEIAFTTTTAGTGAAATDMYVTMTLEYMRRRNTEGTVQVDRGGF